MTSPPGDAEFDGYSKTYDQAVNDALPFPGLKVDFFTRVKADYLLDLIRAHRGAGDGARLIDIGCGVGNYHPLLIDHVGSIDGVDVSSNSVDAARSRNPRARYAAYDGRRLPFADASFDVAVTICVMHHVPPANWPAFVAEARRVLAPGGMFVVFEHNPFNPVTRRIVNNCVFDANAVLLKPRETQALLAGAGFSDLETRAILSIPPTGRALRAIDRTLGLLPLGAQYYVKATA